VNKERKRKRELVREERYGMREIIIEGRRERSSS
jgi:hypothetical protein